MVAGLLELHGIVLDDSARGVALRAARGTIVRTDGRGTDEHRAAGGSVGVAGVVDHARTGGAERGAVRIYFGDRAALSRS